MSAAAFGQYASDILTLLVKFSYPTYASFKAVISLADTDDTTWLIYWVVASLFTFLENYFLPFVSWVPFFMLARLLVYIWLQLPYFNGSIFLFNKVVRPFFSENSRTFDVILANNNKSIRNTVSIARHSLSGTYEEILRSLE